MNVNNQYFSKEQVEAGELTEFVNVLMKQSYGVGKYMNDIHIYPADLGAFMIDWVNVPWDHSFGGSFQYVDEDEEILKPYKMPDGHYEYYHDDEEYEEALDELH